MAGYSGRLLFDKLNLKPQFRVVVLDAPPSLAPELAQLAQAPTQLPMATNAPIDAAILFAVEPEALEVALAQTIPRMVAGGMIWLAWPKRTSGIATNLGEADVRRIGLATDWVDVKVCAIDDQWSGLKFLRRRSGR